MDPLGTKPLVAWPPGTGYQTQQLSSRLQVPNVGSLGSFGALAWEVRNASHDECRTIVPFGHKLIYTLHIEYNIQL